MLKSKLQWNRWLQRAGEPSEPGATEATPLISVARCPVETEAQLLRAPDEQKGRQKEYFQTKGREVE